MLFGIGTKIVCIKWVRLGKEKPAEAGLILNTQLFFGLPPNLTTSISELANDQLQSKLPVVQ